ncbi:hypothetical protein [Verrucosispora sp. NA02020]|uniref:hypothetical protein n=1 Tax=unclassified Micromonospora TaxID=2617518 RepID=UPI001591C5CA|nr:hypothetical protein [Verrucosispora sp. NA02020]QKW14907.1 hypothetical protein HUT12_20420 [Verrucosispora sp. NA02020]
MGGVPTIGVRVLLDIAAVNPTGITYLTVFPNGATRPIVASLTVSKDEVLTNFGTRSGLGATTGPIGASGGTRTVTLTGGVVPAGALARSSTWW